MPIIMKLLAWILNAGELAAIGNRMVAILTDGPASDTHLAALRGRVCSLAEDILSAYGRTGVSPVTALMGAAKSALDAVLSSAVTWIRGLRSNPDTTVAGAAEAIYVVLKRHNFGSPTKSNAVQSTSVLSMLDELSSPQMQAAIATAGVHNVVDPIGPAHAEFERVYQQKVSVNAPTTSRALAKRLRPLRLALTDAINYLNSRASFEPDVFQSVNARVAELVSEANATARARQTKKGDKKALKRSAKPASGPASTDVKPADGKADEAKKAA